MWREVIVLLVLAMSAAVGTYAWHPRAPALYLVESPLRDDEITLTQVLERWKGDVLWLDARPQSDFDKGHVPGARQLNEQKFDDQLFSLLEDLQTNTRPVIIYCSGQQCEASRLIRERLLERVPLENVYVLRDGWKAWEAAAGKK